METLKEITIEKAEVEKFLIYQSEDQQNKVLQEVEARANILNALNKASVNNETIKELNSLSQIDLWLFNEHLKVNTTMRAQHKAGKIGVQKDYRLPENLEAIRNLLIEWIEYKMNFRQWSKYEFLIFTTKWEPDLADLDKHFIKTQAKIFIEDPASLAEYQTIKLWCVYLNQQKATASQILNNRWIQDRIVNEGKGFEVNYRYFLPGRSM